MSSGDGAFRGGSYGPRPAPRNGHNAMYSHQHTSSRTSNFSNDASHPGRALHSPHPQAPGLTSQYSGAGRDGASIRQQQMYGNWNSAAATATQTSHPRSPDVPMSPSASSVISLQGSVMVSGTDATHHGGSQHWISALRNGSNNTPSSGTRSIGETTHRSVPSVDRFEQRYMYIYNALAGGVRVQFILTVEAAPLTRDESVITLTVKAGGIEQSLCGKEYLRISMDPQSLKFHVFIFPKPSLPANCLYCVRVWLESLDNVQHRIFSDENLWVGRDPPFASIQHVALTQHGPPTIPFPPGEVGVVRKAYKGFAGRAQCDFVAILKNVSAPDSVWSISMEYQAGGISRLLFDPIKVRLHCRVEDVKFVIYTVPIDSSIPYSNHRVRAWIRAPDGVHVRLFKSDEFRIGSHLAFEPLRHGPGNVVFATRDESTPTIALHSSLLHSEPPKAGSFLRGQSYGSNGEGSSSVHGGGALEREARADAEYEERRMGIGNLNPTGQGTGGPLPFDESLPSYSASLGVGI